MGKKRKSGRSSAVGPKNQQTEEEGIIAAKYDQDETFADSQDDFFTGKDEIMLEEGLSRKRRKQIDEEGNNTPVILPSQSNKAQTTSSNPPTKKSSATTLSPTTTRTP
jgi:hypothetical protein